jgi:small subunit ribosomal protein S16
MSVSIRLARRGKKSQPHYYIIVQDKEKHPSGGFIEKLGFYKSYTNPIVLELDVEKAKGWIAKGAKASPRVATLIKLAEGKAITETPQKHKKFGGKFVKQEKAAAPAEVVAPASEKVKEEPKEEVEEVIAQAPVEIPAEVSAETPEA